MRTLITNIGLLFLSIAFFPSATQAENGLQVSLVAGLNTSTLTYHGDDAPNSNNWRLGVLGGIGCAVYFSENIGIRAEGLYCQKGYTLQTTNDKGIHAEYTTTFAYIDIPITGIVLLPGKRVTPYLFAGPVFGIKVGDAKTTVNGAELRVESDNIKALNVGATLGIGTSIPVGSNAIGFDARYTAGLANIDKETATTPWERRHTTLSFTARYSFSL